MFSAALSLRRHAAAFPAAITCLSGNTVTRSRVSPRARSSRGLGGWSIPTTKLSSNSISAHGFDLPQHLRSSGPTTTCLTTKVSEPTVTFAGMADHDNKNLDERPIDVMSEAESSTGDAIDTAGETVAEVPVQAGKPADDAVDAIHDTDGKAGPTIIEIGPDTPQEPTRGLGETAAVTVGALGIALVAAPALVALPALGFVGFGASGPIAGSIAAAAQSGMGSVVAPSLFATLQSAAMGGYGTAAVLGTVQATGGVMAAASAAKIAQIKSWF